jgi:hypothetical protein
LRGWSRKKKKKERLEEEGEWRIDELSYGVREEEDGSANFNTSTEKV